MHDDTKVMAVKGCSAWIAVWLAKVGIHQWGDAAAMLASFYSLLLICEWMWKKYRLWRKS